MGPMIKYSKNLILRIESEVKAKEVLDLYLRNKTAFEQFEPTRPSGFYTLSYHSTMLKRELKAYHLGTFLRYYVYKPYNTSRIIGAVNFNFMHTDAAPFAEIGYKIDSLYQNQGIGYEACVTAINVIRNEYCFERIDARIHPDNTASIKLAEKIGFKPISLEKQSANIMGRYTDLIRYSLSTSDIQ